MAFAKLFGNLRKYVNENQIEVSAATVREALMILGDINPNLGEAIWRDGVLRPFVKITINGRDIQLVQGLDTPLGDDDKMAVFPPIAGG